MKNFPTTLFITFGFPGSGKTHFSEKLAKKIGAYHLNIDQLRQTLFVTPKYTLKEHQHMVRAMDYLAKVLLEQGVSVIYDANLPKRAYRQRLQRLAKKANAKFHTLRLLTPVELAIERVAYRNHKATKSRKSFYPTISQRVLQKLKNDTETLTLKENAITLDGTLPFPKQFALFKTQLSKLNHSLPKFL